MSTAVMKLFKTRTLHTRNIHRATRIHCERTKLCVCLSYAFYLYIFFQYISTTLSNLPFNHHATQRRRNRVQRYVCTNQPIISAIVVIAGDGGEVTATTKEEIMATFSRVRIRTTRHTIIILYSRYIVVGNLRKSVFFFSPRIRGTGIFYYNNMKIRDICVCVYTRACARERSVLFK